MPVAARHLGETSPSDAAAFFGAGGSSPQEFTEDASSEAQSFLGGDHVVAVRDLRVRGTVVVKQGGRGRVVGPASSPGRVCVQFERREDNSDNRLNCLPDELRHLLPGGHHPGNRVCAARQLEVPGSGRSIAPGTPGVIIGPSRAAPQNRLLVSFATGGGASNGGGAGSEDLFEEVACFPDDVESAIAGNFRRGNAVIATRDLRVGGAVVVREGVLGTVVGPSNSDSQHRVTVSFSHREDGSRNRLNCIINEIRLYVAGGLEVGSRVQALRPISLDGRRTVPQGSCGVVLGPATEEPLSRLLVRFEPEAGATAGGASSSSASASSMPGGPVECDCRADDLALLIAGGFRRGESVIAAKDLRVKGVVVVKQGVVGTVIGQSSTDPSGRVTIAFARREDGRCNNLNVVPTEIQRTPCTGGLMPGDKVAALRQLLVVPKGTHGTVVGPSGARSSRVAVRFNPVIDGEEVVLHVEPGDLRVLHAVGDDVDDTGFESGEGEDLTEDIGRPTVAGGYGRGDAVTATRDLCVAGNVVVRAGVFGTVIGPSGHDPNGRITVAFAWREDGKTNNLNVVPSEITSAESRHIAKGELCAICLGELISDTDVDVEGTAPDVARETEGPPLDAAGANRTDQQLEDICRMPCGHVLHAACVRAYLNHQTGANVVCPGPSGSAALAPLRPAQCPVCRREMLP